MKKILPLFYTIFLALFFGCNKHEEYVDLRGTDYSGSQSCITCHQTVHQSALQTAHYKATAPASVENGLGNFTDGQNVFQYDATTQLKMEKRHDSLYQVLYKNGKEVAAYKFDIVFGGQNAQTAVYWRGNDTYELPISYYKSVDKWGTSPGFSASQPYFERRIVQDCYACHSSNINKVADKNHPSYMAVDDVMRKEHIIHGIDCERCHGPAKKHVDYHLKFPNIKAAHGIVNFNSLTNQQKLDACAICHSGSAGLKIKSRFEFKMGNNLLDFYRTPPTTSNDVHGNQAGLLSQSKCFTKSGTLNCITCHSPHENATKNLASYSKICISCHTVQKHNTITVKAIAQQQIKGNCIDCHMPNQASNAIDFKVSHDASTSSYNLRTHRIALYLDAK